ncbi:MAG: hypothetical protein DMG40_15035 [Acidobacteria bacterium]|nr:MAG: hypothetical protein DMG40_15035 [Acidobacteriota bacterium]
MRLRLASTCWRKANGATKTHFLIRQIPYINVEEKPEGLQKFARIGRYRESKSLERANSRT